MELCAQISLSTPRPNGTFFLVFKLNQFHDLVVCPPPLVVCVINLVKGKHTHIL